MPRQTRRPAVRPSVLRPVVVLAAAAAVATSGGCAISPVVNRVATEISYAPSDGVQGTVAGVQMTNVFFVGQSEDGPAQLYGVVVNQSGEQQQVGVDGPGGLQATVTAPPRVRVPLGADQATGFGAELPLPDDAEVDGSTLADPVGAAPGLLVPVTFSVSGQDLELQVPLLDGSLREYQTLRPSPTTALPTPSPSQDALEGVQEEGGEADGVVSGDEQGGGQIPIPTSTASTGG